MNERNTSTDVENLCRICPCNADCENRGKGVDGVVDVEWPLVKFYEKTIVAKDDPYYHCYAGPREQMNPFGVKPKGLQREILKEVNDGN